jgi:hypothetical protein
MNSYLNKLARDQTSSDDNFVEFLNMYINTKETFIKLIDALKSKLKLENIDEYFEKIKKYFETYKIKRSDVLKTSHVFCNCGIYTEAPLCCWVQKNIELFETDIYFFNSLFLFNEKSKINIDNDVSTYSIDKLYKHEILTCKQTDDEKLKLLNTIVTNYNYLLNDTVINA